MFIWMKFSFIAAYIVPIKASLTNDICLRQPCQNGGQCFEGQNDYRCECTPEWTGGNCTTANDRCTKSPCQNGGKCFDGQNTYICECTTGWTDINCTTAEQGHGVCSSNPCQNGGQCLDEINAYMCNCTTGWAGTQCAQAIQGDGVCVSNPCQNGGKCADGLNAYTCECASGWIGNNCEKAIQGDGVCVSNPCQNGGKCADGLNAYTCECASGWLGNNCEKAKQDSSGCISKPCQNGGRCIDGLNAYACDCAAGWIGEECEQEYDECSSSPCYNGGRCTDWINTYTCECMQDKTGQNCELDLDAVSEAVTETSVALIGGVAAASFVLVVIVTAVLVVVCCRRRRRKNLGIPDGGRRYEMPKRMSAHQDPVYDVIGEIIVGRPRSNHINNQYITPSTNVRYDVTYADKTRNKYPERHSSNAPEWYNGKGIPTDKSKIFEDERANGIVRYDKYDNRSQVSSGVSYDEVTVVLPDILDNNAKYENDRADINNACENALRRNTGPMVPGRNRNNDVTICEQKSMTHAASYLELVDDEEAPEAVGTGNIGESNRYVITDDMGAATDELGYVLPMSNRNDTSEDMEETTGELGYEIPVSKKQWHD